MADFVSEMRGAMGKAFGEMKRQHDQLRAVGGESALLRQELSRQQNELRQLAGVISGVSGPSGHAAPDGQIRLKDDRVMYIDEIPGRRVPFDFLVKIPFGFDVDTTQQQSDTVSQDGPFIALARYAVFQSAMRVTKNIDGRRVDFVGRSNGRFRPCSSVWDLNDSQAFNPIVGLANPGNGSPIYASPSNHSGFRSMQWDGTIEFINQGSGFFRSNRPVPSAFYTDAINSVFQLGAMDFFERGETLQWKATPLHTNNPSGGNTHGFMPGNIFPDASSQYDVHEGILDQYDEEASQDPVIRIPDGILHIGFAGFRILQPPGPVQLT